MSGFIARKTHHGSSTSCLAGLRTHRHRRLLQILGLIKGCGSGEFGDEIKLFFMKSFRFIFLLGFELEDDEKFLMKVCYDKI